VASRIPPRSLAPGFRTTEMWRRSRKRGRVVQRGRPGLPCDSNVRRPGEGKYMNVNKSVEEQREHSNLFVASCTEC
jgi:hypothetical protein